MTEFGEFLEKLGLRVAKHVGVVAVVQSPVMKRLAYSPTLLFVLDWGGPLIFLLLVGVEIGLPVSNFDMVKKTVSRFPYQGNSHITLAVAAARNYDFRLAEAEFLLANQFDFAVDDRVLGAVLKGAETEVFPRKFMQGEIERLEKLTQIYQGYRDLLLSLAIKRWQISDVAQAKDAWIQAHYLDPNNSEVIRVGNLFTK